MWGRFAILLGAERYAAFGVAHGLAGSRSRCSKYSLSLSPISDAEPPLRLPRRMRSKSLAPWGGAPIIGSR